MKKYINTIILTALCLTFNLFTGTNIVSAQRVIDERPDYKLDNIGLADSDEKVYSSGIIAFVSESEQGATDLNADGDALDHVPHFIKSSSQMSLGVAVVPFSTVVTAYGDNLIYNVFEYGQGMMDLNGDGDTDDHVVFYNGNNLGVASTTAPFVEQENLTNPSFIPVFVSEKDNGATDLNGDGDADDRIVHILDTITSNLTSLQLALPIIGGEGDLSFLSDDYYVFYVSEKAQGTDLNLDLDTNDLVPHLYNHTTGAVTNLFISTLIDPPKFCINDKFIFRIKESLVPFDYTLDGDFDDILMVVMDATAGGSGGTVGPSLSIDTSTGSEKTMLEFNESRSYVVFTVNEMDSLIDLNGDGDMTDHDIVHLYDIANDVTTNLGVAALQFKINDSHVVVSVDENGQGQTDLNGDGDTSDQVAHLYDIVGGQLLNLGVHSTHIEMGDSLAALGVPELAQGSSDLNNDGDQGDEVLHVVNLNVGSVDNTALASFTFSAAGNKVLISVSEWSQGQTDLNGDGDFFDYVVYLGDVNGTMVDLKTTTSESFGFKNKIASIHVNEATLGSGVDLNNDGDIFDSKVLHRLIIE